MRKIAVCLVFMFLLTGCMGLQTVQEDPINSALAFANSSWGSLSDYIIEENTRNLTLEEFDQVDKMLLGEVVENPSGKVRGAYLMLKEFEEYDAKFGLLYDTTRALINNDEASPDTIDAAIDALLKYVLEKKRHYGR